MEASKKPHLQKPSLIKRVGKALKAMQLLVRNPWKLNLILDQNEEWEARVRKRYGLKSLPVIPFRHLIPGIITVEPYAFLDGGSLPTDLALLKQLASDIPSCRYFEIGTWRGESVSNVATSADVCFTLNLPDQELAKLSDDDDFLLSQRCFSQHLRNVTHLFGDSRTFDFEGLQMKFDLIFIDGDHHYESIVHDTQKVLQYLAHDDSVIVWHDYAYNPESLRYEIMAAILDACPASLHSFLYHVGNTNCALLYRNKVPSFAFKRFALPEQRFSVQLKTGHI